MSSDIYTKNTYTIKTPKLQSKTEIKFYNNINMDINSNNPLLRKVSKTPENSNETKNTVDSNKLNISNTSNNLKINKFYNKVRATDNLNNIPTFEKVVMLQKLLKELSSVKGRFKKNIDKLTEKINKKCFEYYKNKIFIKEILDYCDPNNPEEHKNYYLIDNTEKYFDEEIYEIIYDFYFLIRNENHVMLQIIKYANGSAIKELSDFLINFLYENVINNSFIQD